VRSILKKWANVVVVIPDSWLRCFCKFFTEQKGGLLGRGVYVWGQELKEMVLWMENYKAKIT
jgi:hypothetical protein